MTDIGVVRVPRTWVAVAGMGFARGVEFDYWFAGLRCCDDVSRCPRCLWEWCTYKGLWQKPEEMLVLSVPLGCSVQR